MWTLQYLHYLGHVKNIDDDDDDVSTLYISADAQVHADVIASQQYRLSPGNNVEL